MSEEQMNYEENMEVDVDEDEAFEEIAEEVEMVEENDTAEETEKAEETSESVMEVVEPPKKRRGRPRKDASAKTETVTETESVPEPIDETEPPKKRRGRPRKDASAPVTQAKEVTKEEAPKRRGRPRKSEQAETSIVETTKRAVRTGGKVTAFSVTVGNETKSVEEYTDMVEATYAGKINTLAINLDLSKQRIVAKINETIELSFPL